jgi:hypothetical protein
MFFFHITVSLLYTDFLFSNPSPSEIQNLYFRAISTVGARMHNKALIFLKTPFGDFRLFREENRDSTSLRGRFRQNLELSY